MAVSSAIDSGYSWVILFSIFCSNILFITGATGGILLVEFRRYFDLSSVAVSGMITVGSVINSIACLPAGALLQRYGNREITVAATLCGVMSYFIGAFVPEFAYFYFTDSVLLGIAEAMLWVNGQVIIQQYFDKRRAFASAVFMTAFSVGGAAYPPFGQILIDTYGWRGTYIVLSGCWLQILPLVAMLRTHTTKVKVVGTTLESNCNTNVDEVEPRSEVGKRPNGPQEDENLTVRAPGICASVKIKCVVMLQEVFDVSLISRGSFVVYCLFRMGSKLVRSLPEYFLPARAISEGIVKIDAAFLVTITGIAQTVTRLIAGFLSDQFQADRIIICTVAGVVAGLVLVSSYFMWRYVHFVVYAVLIGISTGIFSALEIPVGVDLIGLEKLPRGFGIVSFLQGVTTITMLPVAAAIVDATGSYKPPYMLFGIMEIGVCALFFFVIFRTRQQSRKKDIITEEQSLDLRPEGMASV